VSGHNELLRCPDWRRLAAARDASPAEPPGWEEALRHLDACADCRPAAIAADPLLAFRRLPAPALAADEAESMRLRVAALVGASRITGAPPSSSRLAAQLTRRRRSFAALPLRQVAAAAVVAVALLAGGNAPQGDAVLAFAPAAGLPNHPASTPALDAAIAAEPVLDELDRPFDHVVQWNGDDLSVVLVVDGRLGV
jgi:hypothetical protein